MNLKIMEKNDIPVIYLIGQIDLTKAPKIKDDIFKEIEEKNYTKMVVNLKDLEYIDSSGIGVLLRITKKMMGLGNIRYCCINEKVAPIMNMTGLKTFFQIDDLEEESLEKLGISEKDIINEDGTGYKADKKKLKLQKKQEKMTIKLKKKQEKRIKKERKKMEKEKRKNLSKNESIEDLHK